MFGRRAFSVAGPAACNSLSDTSEIRHVPLTVFRRPEKFSVLVLVHSVLVFSIQRIRGFAITRYINLPLTLTLTSVQLSRECADNVRQVKRVQDQWRIQKFVLGGGGRSGSLGTVHPVGVQGAKSPLRAWGQSPP